MVMLNTIAFSNCSRGSSFSSSAVTLRRTPFSSVALTSRRLHNSLRQSALPRYPCILSISSNDIKVNSNIEVDGSPWRVLEFLHVKPGKGAAFVRTKMRNYITGNTVEKTFRAGATIDEADITKELKQFTYKDGEQFVFMDMSTYEESRLNEKDLGDKTKWLKEGMECNVLNWKGKTIDVELPITVNYKIIEGDMALRGDREKAGTRPVTIETGAVINVPLFVGAGEEIVVDTRTGTYVTRV